MVLKTAVNLQADSRIVRFYLEHNDGMTTLGHTLQRRTDARI